jgi:hypothetical protein
MFGGQYPNIDRWAMTAGRYEGAKAEEAVPSPSVAAHRSCFLRGRSAGGILRAMASMDWDDYLRHEAAMYRQLAEKAENVLGKEELLDLAAVCEEVADSIEDRLTGG